LKQGPLDCVVVRHQLPDMSGPRLARELAKLGSCKNLPVVLFGRRPSAKREVAEMERAGKSLALRTAVTMKAVRDELDTLLRPAALASGKSRRKGAADAVDENAALAGKRVLVVDDDLRNIFALTSLLERHKMDVRFAENGKAAIESLKSEPGIDIVLMDVMMPEMDGYDTMRAIRADDQFRRLPIVALTARAMKGDREKCIEAGASDYIPKPVVPDQLLALLRVWFTK
jgi:CheY-like chemotaxis protein